MSYLVSIASKAYFSLTWSETSYTGFLQMKLITIELIMRKPAFCICKNKDADQLGGNREADQHLYFHYTDSTIPLLPKS